MNHPLFILQVKKWILNKIIIWNNSKNYKQKKDALFHVKGIFGHFLKYPNSYSVSQIALLIKRHEGLLEVIMPIPTNPSYENSLVILTKLIEEAEQIINQYNLTL